MGIAGRSENPGGRGPLKPTSSAMRSEPFNLTMSASARSLRSSQAKVSKCGPCPRRARLPTFLPTPASPGCADMWNSTEPLPLPVCPESTRDCTMRNHGSRAELPSWWHGRVARQPDSPKSCAGVVQHLAIGAGKLEFRREVMLSPRTWMREAELWVPEPVCPISKNLPTNSAATSGRPM